MIQRLLRVAAFAAVFAFLFPVAGCVRFHEDLVVYADGSGKMTLTVGLSQAFIDKMQEMGGNEDMEEKAGLDPEDLENTEGLVAFTKPVASKKDGWSTTTCTAYFDDINKVKIYDKQGETRKVKLAFVYKKDGDNHVLEIDDRFTADDSSDKMDELPDEQKAAIWEQAKPMLKGFEISKTVKMPGDVTSVEGYANKNGRSASTKVTEEAIKGLDDLGKSMKAAKRKVVSAKGDTDAEFAAFKKELADAKAAWPKIKEELKAESDKKKEKGE
jgi:hypothetical protein